MKWGNSARNFIILMVFAFALLFIDLYFYTAGSTTFSETLWGVNQWTLALAFGSGVVVGHVFSVPSAQKS